MCGSFVCDKGNPRPSGTSLKDHKFIPFTRRVSVSDLGFSFIFRYPPEATKVCHTSYRRRYRAGCVFTFVALFEEAFPVDACMDYVIGESSTRLTEITVAKHLSERPLRSVYHRAYCRRNWLF